ncbi:MAG: C45 family peptidase [Bdellovibrionota bacterium]
MRHLKLSGTARERGLTHGKAWPKEIHEFAAIRKSLIKEAMPLWSEHKLKQLLDAHIEFLKKDKELWEEFAGIAEGAAISLRDLMILNNHTDLRDFAEGDFDERLLECSCFAYKKGTKTIAGQTWDMHASAQPYVAHLSIEKENFTQEVFTLTGCLGLAGVSNKSFAVFINNLRSREVNVGYAWPAFVRMLLNCQDIAQAQSLVKEKLPSSGRNFLLVEKEHAINLEVTGKRFETVGNLKQGTLFHTNHYVGSLKETEEEGTRSKTTVNRYNCLEKISPEVISASNFNLEAVADKILIQNPGVLSIPPSPTEAHASASCGGLIYDFESQEGISFAGLYAENDHLKI